MCLYNKQVKYLRNLGRKVIQLLWVSKLCFTLSIDAQPLEFRLKVLYAAIKKCFTNILATTKQEN